MANSINRLKNFFGIRNFTPPNSKVPEMEPAKAPKDLNRPPRGVKFPSQMKRIWDWWVSETHDSNKTLQDRMTRYSDLDYMIYNDGIMSMAYELYADEAVQADSQNVIIGAEAKPEVKKEIERLLTLWGFDQPTLRSLAGNIALYGDSFSINSVDINGEKGEKPKGILEVSHVDVREIKNRLEFKASNYDTRARKSRALLALTNTDKALKKLASLLASKKEQNEIADFYKTYLFGYELQEGMVVPPWNVSHYRIMTTKSEFWPFGRSLFVNSLALFRQYKAAKNLAAIARASNLPKEIYEVKIDEDSVASEMEKWESVNEARQEFHNMGVTNQRKEEFAAGGEVWYSQSDLNYRMETPSMQLDQIKDIELLRDELIIASRIPKGYLIVDRGAFGTSGQALLYQFKPFGRAVFSVQSVILREIAHMLRLNFMITEKFQEEFTDFVLYMNFPVIEEAQDRLRMKNDTLRLGADIISNIQNALGTRDGLPPDVVAQILGQFSFLEPDDIDKWVTTSAKELGLMERSGKSLINSKMSLSEKTKISESLNEDIIQDAFAKAMGSGNFKEGTWRKMHWLNSSKNIDNSSKTILELVKDKKLSRKSLKS